MIMDAQDKATCKMCGRHMSSSKFKAHPAHLQGGFDWTEFKYLPQCSDCLNIMDRYSKASSALRRGVATPLQVRRYHELNQQFKLNRSRGLWVPGTYDRMMEWERINNETRA